MPRSVGGLCGGLGWLLGGQRRVLSGRTMWPHLSLGAPGLPFANSLERLAARAGAVGLGRVD